MNIYLVRHGETEWNVLNKLQGKLDSSLSSKGVEQASRIATVLTKSDIEHIYCSPTQRALETAEPLSKKLTIPIEQIEGLNECSFGELEGKTFVEAEALYPGFTQKWRTDPFSLSAKGAESAVDFQQRVENTFRSIIDKCTYKTILIITHGGVISVILNFSFFEHPPKTKSVIVKNGSISLLKEKENSLSVCYYDNISHLTKN